MKHKKNIWFITRLLTFLVVSIFNTLLIRPEDIGSWKNYLGYALLMLAILDITRLILWQIKAKKGKK